MTVAKPCDVRRQRQRIRDSDRRYPCRTVSADDSRLRRSRRASRVARRTHRRSSRNNAGRASMPNALSRMLCARIARREATTCSTSSRSKNVGGSALLAPLRANIAGIRCATTNAGSRANSVATNACDSRVTRDRTTGLWLYPEHSRLPAEGSTGHSTAEQSCSRRPSSPSTMPCESHPRFACTPRPTD